jgi:hypothetical protein
VQYPWLNLLLVLNMKLQTSSCDVTIIEYNNNIVGGMYSLPADHSILYIVSVLACWLYAVFHAETFCWDGDL